MSFKLEKPKPIVELHPKGKKAISWRKDPIILARLTSVAQMILAGAETWQIAAALDYSLVTARRDVTRVRTMWREGSEAEIDAKRDQSIAQYKMIQTRAWAEYNKAPSPGNLRVILDAQVRIDDIQGNQMPKSILMGELDIEQVRNKRWQQVQGLLADIITEDDSDEHGPNGKADPADKPGGSG